MGLVRLALRGLVHFQAMLWPIAFGVAVATAVIVGALLVGDSVRGSLRYLALDRIGKIDHLLIAPRFFDESTIEAWRQQSGFPQREAGRPLPAIVFPQVSIEKRRIDSDDSLGRSSDVLLLGIRPAFWELGDKMPKVAIGRDEIALNAALAKEIGVSLGDEVTLRLPAQSAVPADSPLGRRDTETVNLPGLKVVSILDNRSLARFDLRSNQRPSMNAFVAIDTIQDSLERSGQVNAALIPAPDIDAKQPSRPPDVKGLLDTNRRVFDSLPLTLADLGIRISHVNRFFPDEARGETGGRDVQETAKIFDYFQVTSEQLLLNDDVVAKIRQLWPADQSTPLLTYLANGIRVASEDAQGMSVPYSMISAVEPTQLHSRSIGFSEPSIAELSTLREGEVIIHSWLASQLNARVGESLSIDYFLPEAVDGKEIEKNFIAKIVAIVPLTEPDTGYARNRVARFSQRPTPFNDPAMTPDVPGITDQSSISNWDVPFPLTRTIRREDDEYVTNHRLTPKLFIPLAQGQALFGSRFGSVTSVRIASGDKRSVESLEQDLTEAIRPLAPELGWQMIPLRAQQLTAARGTTPFDILFLALSSFVIFAALILVALLFRLGIERRAEHWGLLLSLGWPSNRVRRLLGLEGMILSTVGAFLGVGLGLLYARAVLSLLHSWWVGAVGVPFLTFFATPTSILVGFLSGILMALSTIAIATRFLVRQPAVQLLRGRVEQTNRQTRRTSSGWMRWVVGLLIVAVVVTLGIGMTQSGQTASGAFVGAGMLVLIAALMEIARRLRRDASTATANSSIETRTLVSLAMSSIRRHPLRTTLAVALVSVATLLILSMSLFEAVPTVEGTGGFQLIAESSVSIGKSLRDRQYLRETLGEKASAIESATVIPIRVRSGDDAGCNNLYQAAQPKVLGVSPSMAEFDRENPAGRSFAWAGAAVAANKEEASSRWRLLERDGDGSREHPFPVFIDQNTALWGLHLTGGVSERFSYAFGTETIHFETIGLLQNTILQGSLILSEKNFVKAFPQLNGYRSWLIHLPDGSDLPRATEAIESGWSDEGMDVMDSDRVLQNLLAVQNTYLKAFQSLGALGLLLGTVGLAVVQIRSVMERQSEFALLRAIGFTRERIGLLIMLESLVLLIAGLGVGCFAAAIALLPTIFHGTLQPTFITPMAMLAIVAASGIAASLLAVRRAMQLKMIESLRNH